MRISYRTLAALIEKLDEDQKNADITVDVFDGESFASFSAEFRIVNEHHDNLIKGHPVISVNLIQDPGPRVNDIEWITRAIGLNKLIEADTKKENSNEPQ